MFARLSELVHEWMGWCPNTQPQMHREAVRLEDNPVVPSARGSYRDLAVRWLGLYRNQIILSTIGTVCAGVFMFAFIGGWSHPDIFIIGFLAGLPLSAIFGIWYWRTFNKVLNDGPVDLFNWHDKKFVALCTIPAVVSIFVWTLVLFGMIPGVNLKMADAFFGGIVAMMPWGILFAIQIWESMTRCRLHYDGNVLQLEKEETYAVR